MEVLLAQEGSVTVQHLLCYVPAAFNRKSFLSSSPRNMCKRLSNKDTLSPPHNPAPVGFFFVEKKGGGLWLCIDYRGLNSINVKYSYSLPLVPAALEQLLHQGRSAKGIQPSAYTSWSWVENCCETNRKESSDRVTHPTSLPISYYLSSLLTVPGHTWPKTSLPICPIWRDLHVYSSFLSDFPVLSNSFHWQHFRLPSGLLKCCFTKYQVVLSATGDLSPYHKCGVASWTNWQWP